MATYTVNSGQTSSGITLNTGDTMTVLHGGSAINTTINGPAGGNDVDGGFQDVFGKTTGTLLITAATRK